MLEPKSGRVVHVTCDSALKEADWLPWPLRRVHPSLLPRLDMTKLFGNKISKHCDPSLAFANSKLAALFHSNELDRRFSEEHLDESEKNTQRRKRQRRFKRLPIRKTSNAVNPGPTATGRESQIPTSPQQRMSMRQRICQYFPPVWVIGKSVPLCVPFIRADQELLWGSSGLQKRENENVLRIYGFEA